MEELERKYEALRKPLYRRREELINGVADPEEKELRDLKNYGEAAAGEGDCENLKGRKDIPMFWLKAMENNPILSKYIDEADKCILESLTDIRGEKEEGNNYKLTFVFAKNDYFTNKELIKIMIVDKDNDRRCLKTVGTNIMWKLKDNNATRVTKSETVLPMRKQSVNGRGVGDEGEFLPVL